MKKLVLKIGLVLGFPVMIFANPGDNGTAPDSFNVQATVSPYCELYSATDISINYNPFDPVGTTGIGDFYFACVKGTQFSISTVSQTGTGNGISGYGQLTDGNGHFINYTISATVRYNAYGVNGYSPNLFSNSLDLTSPTKDQPDVSMDFAVINTGQNVPTGTYSDTVTLVISY